MKQTRKQKLRVRETTHQLLRQLGKEGNPTRDAGNDD